MSQRVLDPLERSSEVLFGLIMVLTFTSSISVAEGGREEARAVLAAALSCNLAWGLVDAAMYVMSSFLTRARGLAIYRSVRGARDSETAHQLIRGTLPPVVSASLTASEVESIRQRLSREEPPPTTARLTLQDLSGALGVFLLVFLSTLPVVIPFMVIEEARLAMRASNGVAILMLFASGWSLGRYAGRPGWRTGLGTVAIGLVLVAVTIALGG